MHLVIGILAGLALHLATTAYALPHPGLGGVNTKNGGFSSDVG